MPKTTFSACKIREADDTCSMHLTKIVTSDDGTLSKSEVLTIPRSVWRELFRRTLRVNRAEVVEYCPVTKEPLPKAWTSGRLWPAPKPKIQVLNNFTNKSEGVRIILPHDYDSLWRRVASPHHVGEWERIPKVTVGVNQFGDRSVYLHDEDLQAYGLNDNQVLEIGYLSIPSRLGEARESEYIESRYNR